MKRPSRSRCAVSAGRWVSYAIAGAATAMGSPSDGNAGDIGLISNYLNTTLLGTNATIKIHTLMRVNPHNQYSFFSGYLGLPGPKVLGTLRHYGPVSHGFVSFVGNPAYHVQVAGASFGPGYAARLGAFAKIFNQPFLPVGSYAYMAADTRAGAHSQWNAKYMAGFPYDNYIGLKYDLGAGVEYGWARLKNVTGEPEDEFELVDYALGGLLGAYAGNLPVPEPASLGLLAFGAVGLLAYRADRRRRTPTPQLNPAPAAASPES